MTTRTLGIKAIAKAVGAAAEQLVIERFRFCDDERCRRPFFQPTRRGSKFCSLACCKRASLRRWKAKRHRPRAERNAA